MLRFIPPTSRGLPCLLRPLIHGPRMDLSIMARPSRTKFPMLRRQVRRYSSEPGYNENDPASERPRSYLESTTNSAYQASHLYYGHMLYSCVLGREQRITSHCQLQLRKWNQQYLGLWKRPKHRFPMNTTNPQRPNIRYKNSSAKKCWTSIDLISFMTSKTAANTSAHKVQSHAHLSKSCMPSTPEKLVQTQNAWWIVKAVRMKYEPLEKNYIGWHS